jgi:hypothetical protein
VVVRSSAVAQQDQGDHQLKYACLLAVLAALAVALVPRATAKQQARSRAGVAERALMARLLDGIATHRDETWRWQRVMHRTRTPYSDSVRRNGSLAYRTWVLRLWHRRAVAAKRQALNPPHRAEWLCIHSYEASWTDPDAPYYGGLQMDREFQATYGAALLHRKGTADHWTPLEQMWVAERAFRTRGFWPWPNTARYCGLL